MKFPHPVFLLAFALLGCQGEDSSTLAGNNATQPPAAAPAPEHDADSNNLLNMAFGAAVVSQPGGLNLESSVVHAIDGMEATSWISPPGTTEETIVYSLLATARVTQVGITAAAEKNRIPGQVAFESSMDGRKWTPLGSVAPVATNSRIMTAVPETSARFIRVQTSEPQGYTIGVRAFHVLGAETEPPATPSFSGCWVINGQMAEIRQDGARIRGTIHSDPPIVLDGGTDNRVATVVWMQGPTWGHGALTRSRDGRQLSGLRFYEEVDVVRGAVEGWFGKRCGESMGLVAVAPNVPQQVLRRAGRYPLFGLVFDGRGQLVEELSRTALDDVAALLAAIPPQRVRLVAYELRYDTAEQNRLQTAARLQSLRSALAARGVDPARLELDARGNEWTGPRIESSLQRLMASRIDVAPFGR